MAADRELVLAALVARLQTATFTAPINGQTGWVGTIGRRLLLWQDVAPIQQPAAFLVEHTEAYEQRTMGAPRRRLMTRLFCYCRTDDRQVVGSTYLNLMVAAIEAALASDDPSRNLCTLGGLVYWARIEGEILKDPGDIDNQALLIVPIAVEMP